MSNISKAVAPLIPANTSADNNTTRIMLTNSVEANSITDGIATIANGFISNLNEPTSDNEIATKYFVDNFAGSGSASAPPTSIQINDWSDNFLGYGNFTWNNLTNTLDVPNITNGIATIGEGFIGNLNNPVNPTDAATKSYIDSSNILTQVTVYTDPSLAYQYTASEFINTIINRTFYANLNTGLSCSDTDMLPTLADIKSTLGSNFKVGYSWTTMILMPKTIDQVYGTGVTSTESSYTISPISYACSIPTTSISLVNFESVTLNSVIQNVTLGSEQIIAYVISAVFDTVQQSQITDQGILTDNFISSSMYPFSIIYPLVSNPIITSVSPVTYTYNIMQTQFIIRSGLTGSISDVLDTATNIVNLSNNTFSMSSSGTFKFSIQNISAYTLGISLNTGWTLLGGNNLSIPTMSCGTFWVSVIISPPSCIIRNLGTFAING